MRIAGNHISVNSLRVENIFSTWGNLRQISDDLLDVFLPALKISREANRSECRSNRQSIAEIRVENFWQRSSKVSEILHRKLSSARGSKNVSLNIYRLLCLIVGCFPKNSPLSHPSVIILMIDIFKLRKHWREENCDAQN